MTFGSARLRGTHRVLAALELKWWPFDSAVWFIAVIGATWARYDFNAMPNAGGVVIFALGAVLVNALVGLAVGIYLRRYVLGSFEEAAALAVTAILATLVLIGWGFAQSPALVPRSVPVFAGAFAVVGVWGVRYLGRAWASSRRPLPAEAERVVVFGAGSAGAQLIRQMRSDPSVPFIPVAVLDDDPRKSRLRIAGVSVRGTRKDLGAVSERFRADAVVLALPNADSSLVREASSAATALGLRTLILPPLAQLMHRSVGADDLREVNVNDLLGRQPVRLDEEAIAREITGKRVLVTGAGGSIGSELCRQIHRFGPAELMMLDRDESALHAVQLSIHGRAMLDTGETILADIRDVASLERIFLQRRPEVVFHAAALKHLPLLESYPAEAWKTNVVGTGHVLRAAERAGVSTFVNVSTDKAANPTSVLGYSKRVAERMTADTAARADGRYVSVRFGNVLGSRGSVLKAFENQIRDGGPVTVTHPEVSRFFMTIAEACQLVLQAAAVGRDGEALVLDMGEPVRIVDMAHMLIERSGRGHVEIVYTGLRAGEKMNEELFGDGEPQDARPAHPLVSHVQVPALGLEGDAMMLYRFTDHARARVWMKGESVDSFSTAQTTAPSRPIPVGTMRNAASTLRG